VAWLIGGSVASSLYGVPRSTLDVDLVAEISPHHVPALVRGWSAHFLADERMILDAAENRRSCNLIHLDSALKIDIFVPGPDAWLEQELSHRRMVEVRTGTTTHVLPFAQPEDVLLHKLRWFLDGGRISDRQWGDILGLVRTRRESLDIAHLERWIDHLRIPREILDAALEQRPKP